VALTPGLDQFRELFAPGLAIPLMAEIDADLETPVSIFLKLADRKSGSFLFESVEAGTLSSRWSFIGSSPRETMTWSLGQEGDPLEAVRRHLSRYRPAGTGELPPFAGGLVGYLSYDLITRIEPHVLISGPQDLDFPDAVLMDFDLVVAFDHLHHVAHLIVECRCDEGDDPDELYGRMQQRVAEVMERLRAPLTPAPPPAGGQVRLQPAGSPEKFEAAVERAREYIQAGDCQQVVLSQRFDAELDLDPFLMYRALRRINPSPYLFFVEHDGKALVGSSPEALVQVRDGGITVRPIAGTRPRGDDAAGDARLAAELLADPKENAEHIMLVDLARNDVGRVAQVGSVRVDLLRSVENYSHVMHMVSQVSGTLLPGHDAVDALRATFPAGTVSGAPKVRAMQIIDELEPARRGPYAGCAGYFSRDGNMDMAITIRTLLQSGRRVSVQAGAGIVMDSDPATEQRETVAKAAALFAAVSDAQGRPTT
jgi:anthranilate synthase component I